jgi:broad specificity phosphatase PhoE
MSERRVPAVLALVRHGESVWITEGRFQGRGDSSLSELGERQAAAVARRMASPESNPVVPVPSGPPEAIWHSPLQRAAQTAAAIHSARGEDAPLVALDSLSELSQGDWEGLRHTEVGERFPDELAAWRADPFEHHAPGGESLTQALERARLATQVILERGGVVAADGAKGTGEPVLGSARHRATDEPADAPPWGIVVAHDGLLRLLMLDLLGVDIERFWSFPFALASVSVLDLRAGVVRLRAHNLDEHIAELDR